LPEQKPSIRQLNAQKASRHKEAIQEARRLAEAGRSPEEIAKVVGKHHSTVRRWVRDILAARAQQRSAPPQPKRKPMPRPGENAMERDRKLNQELKIAQRERNWW
jgi:transposase